MGDDFYRSKDPTNCIKVMKEYIKYTNNRKNTISIHINTNTASPLVYANVG